MHPYQPPTRRQFVKLFSFGVVTSVISGRNLHEMLIGEAHAAGQTNGLLTLKLSTFTALQSSNSSIRLALNSFNPTAMTASPYYPILINRTTGNQFFALEAKCTHQGCVVPPAGGQCPCHFSRYNLDGTVLVGPAPSPLTSYPITYDGSDLLTIEVPGLGYSVTGSPLETAQGSRFQLTFPTQSGLTYEAQFQENIETAGSAVSFADSANGTANLTSIAGTGGNLSVYIPRTTAKGFYTVNVKVTQA
jgi:nitrite reductase/ring-hydroxylating ferredoxin subunit